MKFIKKPVICLKCHKEFTTIDPSHNRICPKCTIENEKEPPDRTYTPYESPE